MTEAYLETYILQGTAKMLNDWLQSHKEHIVVDIKFSYSGSIPAFLIIYEVEK